MAKQVLYMDYSTGRSLQIFLTYLISEGKINDEMYYYLFGDDSLSNDENRQCCIDISEGSMECCRC